MHASAPGLRWPTSRARPSSSAGVHPSSITAPAGDMAHHRARLVAQSIPTNCSIKALLSDGNVLEAAPGRGRHRFMTFLVTDAALHRRMDAEHVPDGLAQRLGAIDDHEHALLDIQAALDEVREQGRSDGGVLGRAVPEPERVLDAVGVDPERDHATAALELDPV